VIFLYGKWVEIYKITPFTEELSINKLIWEELKDKSPEIIFTVCKLNKVFKGQI